MIVSRPLSSSEHFYRSRNASGFYKSFQVTATYTNDISQSHLYRALRKTVLDYHLLVSNVVPKDGSHWYVPLDYVVLGDILEYQSPEENLTNGAINEKFMKYCNEFSFRFSDHKPLFRLIQIGPRDLAAIFEHTIADGLVGNYFHEIFVENLAIVEEKSDNLTLGKEYGPFEFNGMESVIFDFSRDKNILKNSLHPPIDDFVPKPRPSATKPVESTFEMWPGRFPTTKESTWAFKLLNYDPQQTKIILSKCKEHKVTLTAYLEAVVVSALQPAYGTEHYTTCKAPIALRRFLDPEIADPEYHKILTTPNYKILGTSAHGGIADIFEPHTKFSWDLVKRINRDLTHHIKNQDLMNFFYPFTTVESAAFNNEAYFEAQMKPNKADSIKLSNLGLINVPMYGKWSIVNMIFSQDVSPPAADFMLNVISTKAGGLNLTFSYQDHSSLEGEDFDKIVADFRDDVLRYAQ